MSKAGFTHGGFYAHFASKDALIDAAIAAAFDDVVDWLERTATEATADDAMRALLDRYLSLDHRSARATGCPIAALTCDVPRLPVTARRTFTRGVNRVTALIARRLAAVGRDDAEELAASVLAEMVGALALARAIPNDDAAARALAATRARLAARVGIAAV